MALTTLQLIRSRGFFAILQTIVNRLVGEKPIPGFAKIKACFHEKNCLEIGGPSSIFQPKSILPIYREAKTIDNCNFSSKTLWEHKISEGLTFKYAKNRLGRQFVREAIDLKGIKNGIYDCVISSHTLEHVANPLGALFEWKRVLKDEGVLLLVAPHKQGTFDRNRPVTKLSHFIQDYENEVEEHDLSHLTEILKLHDLSMDPQAGTFENFVTRSRDNFNNRCLHHHVFTTGLLIYIIDHVGLKTLFVTTHAPHHIIVLSQKIIWANRNQEVDLHSGNLRFLDKDASWRKSSCFTLDRELLVERF